MSVISPPRTRGSDEPAVPLVHPARRPDRRVHAARLWRGPEADPAWVRPALLGLLALTAVLYLWDLGASGWANSYYSAAVQAGYEELEGVLLRLDGRVELHHRRQDARVALGHGALGARVRCERVERARPAGARRRRCGRPPVRRGQALVLARGRARRGRGVRAHPGRDADVPLQQSRRVARHAPRRERVHDDPCPRGRTHAVDPRDRRARRLRLPRQGVAGVPRAARVRARVPARGTAASSRVASSTSWCSALRPSPPGAGGSPMVQLWPASSRPYIGGSQNNSFWNVLFGYNGFGRLTGNESGSVGGGAQGTTGRWGPTGITRMFNSQFGGQISWLLPAALLLLVAGLAYTATRPRTDRTRAALGLWGGWLVVTGVAFSLGQGIIHEYYSVALAPAIGAIVGIGATTFWARRGHPLVRVLLGFVVATTAVWAYVLLDRTPDVDADVAFRLARRRARHRARARGRAPVARTVRRRDRARRDRVRDRGPRRVLVVDGGATALGIAADRGTRGRLGGTGRPRRLRCRRTGIRWSRIRARERAASGGRTARLRRNRRRRDVPRVRRPAGGGPAAEWVGCSTGRLRARRSPPCSNRARASGGPRPRSARTTRPATSSRRARRSWPSAASTAPTRRRRSPSSSSTCRRARSTTSSRAGAGPGGAGGGPGGAGTGSSTSSAITQWVEQHFTARTVGGTTIYDLTTASAGNSRGAASGATTG